MGDSKLILDLNAVSKASVRRCGQVEWNRILRNRMMGCALMVLLLILTAVSCAHWEQVAEHWGYEGSTGPEHWAQLSEEYAICGTGKAQSPIDIAQAVPSRLAHPRFAYQNMPLRIRNTGHTLQIASGMGGFLEIGTSRHDLVEYHFHRPSGHTLNGRHYEMELHLVHRGGDGERVVVAVFMEKDEGENTSIPEDMGTLPGRHRRTAPG